MNQPARSRRRANTGFLELDLRGKILPYVTASAYRALKGLPAGKHLAVLTDLLPANSTLIDLARDFGGDATTEQIDSQTWRVVIRKGKAT